MRAAAARGNRPARDAPVLLAPDSATKRSDWRAQRVDERAGVAAARPGRARVLMCHAVGQPVHLASDRSPHLSNCHLRPYTQQGIAAAAAAAIGRTGRSIVHETGGGYRACARAQAGMQAAGGHEPAKGQAADQPINR